MTIEEMKARKAELGYTNETIARLSGVPLGTVQKIFAGETKAPRYDTIRKLTQVLGRPHGETPYELGEAAMLGGIAVSETSALLEYGRQKSLAVKPKAAIDEYLMPPKKRIGIADGKYRMPPDELLFDDELSEMFEDL